MRTACSGPVVLFTLLLVLAPVPVSAADAGKDLSLSSQDLQGMTSALPPSVQARILADPAGFLHLLSQVLDQPADLLVLVDKSHLLASDYVPPDLVKLTAYSLSLSRNDLRLRASIMPAVLDMAAAARAEGTTLVFSSSYRSFAYQKVVYEREVKTYGQETADRESAHPGASQHQLGTAMDFGSITDEFADTRAGKWLAAHAWEYGFSLSYPDGYEKVTGYRHESWHYRYITRPAARLQKEYFGDIQQYLLEFLHDNRTVLEARRQAAR
jgi:D-alanyl-D-alanine carboxypeptidase